MNILRYSAPGRIYISGEHAAVYGKPALVCAIDKRLSVTFTLSKKTVYKDNIFPILEKSVIDFLQSKKVSFEKKEYAYSVESTIPIGRGLGSSAAYCACISAGLLELFTGKEWSKEEVNVCAYQMEKYFHKNSSGVDTSTSVMGGLIYYRKEFEFLKSISSLAIRIPKKIQEHLILIDTEKPIETSEEMIRSVGALFNKESNKTEMIFNKMEKVTKRIVVSFMKEDGAFFRDNIRVSQELLGQIGVVSSKTNKLLFELTDVGVGKMIGSGYILFCCGDSNTCKEIFTKKSILYTSFIPNYRGLVKG